MTAVSCNMANINYRSDIDGLRAIAVIAVVLFHAFPEFLSGGFIGVDVFFVISGFLITSIVLREINDARFSFLNFYARRIRRLYPALLLIFFVCLIFGWYGLWSFEYRALGTHTFFSSIFLENFRLIRESVEYFNMDADRQPLLHLWSLSVEEQFYLVLPALLMVTHKYKIIFRSIIILIVTSLLVGVVCTYTRNVWAFYAPFARFWELFSGVALACVCAKWEGRMHLTERNANFFAILSFAVLSLSIIYLSDKNCRLPGVWVVFPVLATVILIATGKQSWVGRKLLGHPWLVFVGLISYPLYLWHWPILSFAKIFANGPIQISTKVICIICSVVLAVVTYRWIEKPVRRGGLSLAMFLLSCMLGITLESHWIRRGHVTAYCASLPQVCKIDAELNRSWIHNPPLPPFKSKVFRGDFVALQYGEGAPDVLFLGDSNMEQYLPSVARVIKEGRSGASSLLFLTHGAWLPVPGHPKEANKTVQILEFVAKQQHLKSIVIAAQWFAYFRDCCAEQLDTYCASFKDILLKMRADGRAVYLVLSIPYDRQLNPRTAVRRRVKLGLTPIEWRYVPEQAQLAVDLWSKKVKAIDMRMRTMADESGVVVLDPLPTLAREGYYSAIGEGDQPIFKDDCHLSLAFVHDHVRLFDLIMGER